MRTAISLLLLLLAAAVFADDDYEYEERKSGPRYVDASSDVNVRSDPEAGSRRLTVLREGERAVILGRAFGWVRVRTESGKKGWIDRRFLDEASTAAAESASAERCPEALEDCPEHGCAKHDSAKLRNRLKRTTSVTGRATRLTVANFKALQTAAMKKVGHDSGELDEEDRARLTGLAVGGNRLREGSRVVVTGYVVGEPRANSGESVNCGISRDANNDYHVGIAARPGSGDHKLDEFRSIVVEMIPQGRPAGWTNPKLKKARDQKRMVKVEGRLFYDDLHKVNGNPASPVGRQPRRISLWEIHPVTSFRVCEKARCEPDSTSGWTKLEEWEP